MRACLASLLILFSSLCAAQFETTSPSFGSPRAQFLPVEEAYRLAVEREADGGIRLYWQIAEDYYLYQHQFKFALEDAQGAIEVATAFPPAVERVDEFFGEVRVYYQDLDLSLHPDRTPRGGTLQVTSQGCADAGLCYPPRKQAFRIDPDSGALIEVAMTAAPASSVAGNGNATSASLLYMLILAFIGGAILNLMPCVFPILSLKVLSFTRSSAADRHLHGWVYAAGVISSFVLVAGLLIALQQAGRAVGWGFQLQSPGFVIGLAYLFIAMGLSLSGVVQLGSSLMNTGGDLAARGGLSGSFFTGVLAVVVASPCTAPFMGSALGYAATQPAATALLVFAALGAGMAAPLLLLSYSTFLRRIMPQPGPWMETLKELLAFPLYATAIWLLWVAGKQSGVNTMAVALAGALLLALGLWLWRYRRWGRVVAVASLAAAVALGSWRGLDQIPNHWRSDERVAWSDQQVAQLRAAGQPVFLDVTADWCITCIANEKAVLHTEEMAAHFADRGVVYMVADWTNYDADIAALLKRHGRNGIPLYLLYPADPAAAPLILPQLLTTRTVLEALDRGAPIRPELADNFHEDRDKITTDH